MSRKTRIVRVRGIWLEDFTESLVFVGQERPSIFHMVHEKVRLSSRPEHTIKQHKRLGYHAVSCGHHYIHKGKRSR